MPRLQVALLALFVGCAHAQTYPSKPVRLVAGFPAGGGVDATARAYAQKLGEYWGQNVIVENRSGANGMVGAAEVVRAPKDGYTLFLSTPSEVALNALLYAKMPYDPHKDLAPISLVALFPNVMVVNADSPYRAVSDLVNAAKAKPAAINWGHAGIGSGTHLNTERFIAAAKIQVTQVPFKGSPEVFGALFTKDVDVYWSPISAAMGHLKSGKLRPLAVSTPRRNPTLPDVPTTGEAGVQGADSPLWFGVWGPAGVPADVVAKINADVRKALAEPSVRERLTNGGNETLDMSAQEFARFVRSEIETYQNVIRSAGIKPQ